MSQEGNTQLTIIFTATSDLVEEGDRLFGTHAEWMAQSHHKEGDLALLRYNVVKGAELSNPLDPSSAPTGNTSFVLHEVYATPAGLADHWSMAPTGWKEFGAFVEWAGKGKITALHGSPIIHSLW